MLYDAVIVGINVVGRGRMRGERGGGYFHETVLVRMLENLPIEYFSLGRRCGSWRN